MTGRLKLLGGERVWLWVLLAPTLVGIAFGTAGSLVASMLLSMTSWDNINPPVWIGFSNYLRTLTDPKFLNSILNTLRFSVLYVPLCVVAGLSAALLVDRAKTFRGLFRAAFFLPSITSAVAVGLIFSWIYARDGGLLNRTLALVGVPSVNWLGEDMILWAVVLANVWGAVGETMIVLLAALQAVPATIYEAAKLDGAGAVRRFFSVTVPLISPALFFQVIISTVYGLQAFEYIYMLTRRTQGESAMATVVYQVYRNGFRWFNMGLASAQANVLALVIVALMIVYFRLEKKWVVYE